MASGEELRRQLMVEGDAHFVDEEWEAALDCYARAIDAVPGAPSAEAFSRRSAVHLKQQNFTDAIADANKAIQLDPSAVKAYLRKGTACFELEEHEAALAAFAAGLRLEPSNATLKKWVRKAEAELQDESTSSDQEGAPQGSVPGTDPPTQAPPTATPAASHPAPTPASTAPNPAPAPAPAPVAAPPPRFRHEWYQSPKQVVVTVFAKGMKQEQVHVEFGEQVLSVTINDDVNKDPYTLTLRLFGKIDPTGSSSVVLGTKVEIRMLKAESIQWVGLEAAARARAAAVQPINVSSDVGNVKGVYPSSSKHKVDWDKLEKEVKLEEKEEPLEGDAGLNRFFQEIYKDADEETRRAMNKSFVESQGTVLSTDWSDVGSKRVDAK